MKSYGPKSLIKIKDDVTILDNQLKHIYRYFSGSQIIVVAGFEYNKVKQRFGDKVQVLENPDYITTNVVKSIGIGLNKSKYDNVLIIYGDLVFNAYTLKAPFGTYSSIVVDSYGLMGNDEVGCVIQDNLVEQMMYDLQNKWAHIAFFTGKELEILKQICSNKKYDICFGFEIMNIIINSGGRFGAFSPKRMRVSDIDCSKDLRKIEYII